MIVSITLQLVATETKTHAAIASGVRRILFASGYSWGVGTPSSDWIP